MTASFIEITPKVASRVVWEAIKAVDSKGAPKRQSPVMLWGAPGIGKTQIIGQIAEKEKARLVARHLGQMEPSDIMGIPVMDGSGGVHWKPSSIMPQMEEIYTTGENCVVQLALDWQHAKHLSVVGYKADSEVFRRNCLGAPDVGEGEFSVSRDASGAFHVSVDTKGVDRIVVAERAILFLDELSTADEAVQNAALQLVLDRKVGDYTLPPYVPVVAAGNRESDGAFVNPMSSALANRFAHFIMVHAVEEWVDYAITHGVKPEIVGFIKAFPNQLYQLNVDALGDGLYGYPTPRAYVHLSDELQDYNYYLGLYGGDIGLANKHYMALLQGYIGPESAALLNAYIETMHNLPTAIDIAENTEKAQTFDPVKLEVDKGAFFGVCISMQQYALEIKKKFDAGEISAEKVQTVVDRFSDFVVKHMDKEMGAWFFHKACLEFKLARFFLKEGSPAKELITENFGKLYAQAKKKG